MLKETVVNETIDSPSLMREKESRRSLFPLLLLILVTSIDCPNTSSVNWVAFTTLVPQLHHLRKIGNFSPFTHLLFHLGPCSGWYTRDCTASLHKSGQQGLLSIGDSWPSLSTSRHLWPFLMPSTGRFATSNLQFTTLFLWCWSSTQRRGGGPTYSYSWQCLYEGLRGTCELGGGKLCQLKHPNVTNPLVLKKSWFFSLIFTSIIKRLVPRLENGKKRLTMMVAVHSYLCCVWCNCDHAGHFISVTHQ